MLDWCIRRVSIDLATTREHLDDAEESYRVNGPFAADGLASEICELRLRRDALEEELAHVDAKRDMLNEADCAHV